MKKRHYFLSIIALAGLSIGSILPATVQADENIAIYYNGSRIVTDAPPVIQNSRTLVPIRVISEQLGATVRWEDGLRMVFIEKDQHQIAFRIDDKNYVKDGEKRTLDAAPAIIAARTMVPLRACAESLDTEIHWDDATRSVVLGSIKPDLSSQAKEEVQTPSAPSTPVEEKEPTQTDPLPVEKLDIVSFDVTKPLQVVGEVVNVRSQPSTESHILGQLQQDDMVQAIAQAKGWYKIKLNNGEEGWVAGWLLGEKNKTVSSTSKNHIGYIRDWKGQGETELTFNVGNADVDVVSNDGNQIMVRIKNAQAPATTNWIEGRPPFTQLSFYQKDNDVFLKAAVTTGGYFRLDRRDNTFSIMAVAKHKNGHTGLAGKTIVIDPGHGSYEARGIDYGAKGKVLGVDEYTFNTPLSFKLKAKLEAAGARVVMTRGKELSRITLAGRAYLANEEHADAFISIHGDSYGDPEVWGSKVFYYDGALRLTSAAQSDVRREFASALNQELQKVTGKSAVNMANFAVNRENEVPSVLVECGFLTNAREEALLASDAYQEKIAEALYKGFANYFAY